MCIVHYLHNLIPLKDWKEERKIDVDIVNIAHITALPFIQMKIQLYFMKSSCLEMKCVV